MERIEARALKPSFLSSQVVVPKTTCYSSPQQALYDDVWCTFGGGGGGGNSSSDDFPVEDLLNLDFNEKEFEGGCFLAEEGGGDVAEKREKIPSSSSCSTFSSAVEDALSVGELAVPYDDLENLEWLSQFVGDDSTSNNLSTLLYPIESFAKKPGSNSSNRSKKPNPPVLPDLKKVPRKPRNKRSRSPGQCWSFSSQPSITTVVSSSSLSSNGSSTYPPANGSSEFHRPPPAKKYKRIKSESGSVSSVGRRCTHCQVQKTPQWRTGPLGPKTLCNACGVRYKSGRLFPEYLPACSPLFSQEVHSNSHRKVLELRRKKEVVGSGEPALAPVVSELLTV